MSTPPSSSSSEEPELKQDSLGDTSIDPGSVSSVQLLEMAASYDEPVDDLSGRAPWYSRTKSSYIVGLAGGTASGKTSVCREIKRRLEIPWVQILSMDNFYRALAPGEFHADYNFDHPDAFDWDALFRVLTDLKRGLAVQIPEYDFKTHSRMDQSTIMYGADVVLFEGILALHDPRIIKLMDLKIFITEEDDIRLIRRIRRDISERARSLDSVLTQYQKTVKPSYDLFCKPTQGIADIVVPRGKNNIPAIDILSGHIQKQLVERGIISSRMQHVIDSVFSGPLDATKFDNVFVIERSDEIEKYVKQICNSRLSPEKTVELTNEFAEAVLQKAKDLLDSDVLSRDCGSSSRGGTSDTGTEAMSPMFARLKAALSPETSDKSIPDFSGSLLDARTSSTSPLSRGFVTPKATRGDVVASASHRSTASAKSSSISPLHLPKRERSAVMGPDVCTPLSMKMSLKPKKRRRRKSKSKRKKSGTTMKKTREDDSSKATGSGTSSPSSSEDTGALYIMKSPQRRSVQRVESTKTSGGSSLTPLTAAASSSMVTEPIPVMRLSERRSLAKATADVMSDSSTLASTIAEMVTTPSHTPVKADRRLSAAMAARKQQMCGVLLTDGGYIMEHALQKVVHKTDLSKDSRVTRMEKVGSYSMSRRSSMKIRYSCARSSVLADNPNQVGLIHVMNAAMDPKNPRFYYRKLPVRIANRRVILADALVGTGNRATMALHVLLDHHVSEANVVFVCLLASARGLCTLARFFPKARFVVGAVVDDLDNCHWADVEGIATMVDRYCRHAGVPLHSAKRKTSASVRRKR